MTTTSNPIASLAETAKVYADAVFDEARLRIEREEMEADIAASLIGNDNPATGKAHSATSAKEAAKDAPAVRDLRLAIIDAERRTILLRAAHEVARLWAWSSVRVPH